MPILNKYIARPVRVLSLPCKQATYLSLHVRGAAGGRPRGIRGAILLAVAESRASPCQISYYKPLITFKNLKILF